MCSRVQILADISADKKTSKEPVVVGSRQERRAVRRRWQRWGKVARSGMGLGGNTWQGLPNAMGVGWQREAAGTDRFQAWLPGFWLEHLVGGRGAGNRATVH